MHRKFPFFTLKIPDSFQKPHGSHSYKTQSICAIDAYEHTGKILILNPGKSQKAGKSVIFFTHCGRLSLSDTLGAFGHKQYLYGCKAYFQILKHA